MSSVQMSYSHDMIIIFVQLFTTSDMNPAGLKGSLSAHECILEQLSWSPRVSIHSGENFYTVFLSRLEWSDL